MRTLFIDTNIVIDLLAKREPFHPEAAKLFSLVDRGRVRALVSSLTFANTNYILSKLKDSSEARSILSKFKVLVIILSLDDKIVDLALNDFSFNDFEDGLQYYTALSNDLDIIITRNLKDFKHANIPVMTPNGFLSM